LRNEPGADRLEFDAALRESRYDNQGLAGTDGTESKHNMTTWKITGIWDPVSWLRLRGSKSKDSRAANFRELYYEQLIGAGGLFGYCGPANTQTQPCNWTLKGNTALRPEQSDTTTIGFVLTPKDLLPGFQFAADYFRINITDAIQQANVTAVLTGCQQENIAADCALLTPAVPGNYNVITALTALASNGSGYLFKGIDFTGSYLLDLGSGRNVDFRLLATRMIDQLYQPNPGGPFVNVVGQTGDGNSFLADFQPTSKRVGNLTATFSQGPVTVTGQVRYVSAGTMNYNGYPTGAPIPAPPATAFNMSTNSVPSYEVYNLTGSYRFQNMGSASLQLYGVINNLFDKTPPVAVGVGGFGANNNFGGTNATFFDTIGRTFKLGVRMTF
jgi:iron complex outermembrane receptor protein